MLCLLTKKGVQREYARHRCGMSKLLYPKAGHSKSLIYLGSSTLKRILDMSWRQYLHKGYISKLLHMQDSYFSKQSARQMQTLRDKIRLMGIDHKRRPS